MPVPKKLRKTYGKIIGANINRLKRKGYSKEQAYKKGKDITERAILDIIRSKKK